MLSEKYIKMSECLKQENQSLKITFELNTNSFKFSESIT